MSTSDSINNAHQIICSIEKEMWVQEFSFCWSILTFNGCHFLQHWLDFAGGVSIVLTVRSMQTVSSSQDKTPWRQNTLHCRSRCEQHSSPSKTHWWMQRVKLLTAHRTSAWDAANISLVLLQKHPSWHSKLTRSPKVSQIGTAYYWLSKSQVSRQGDKSDGVVESWFMWWWYEPRQADLILFVTNILCFFSCFYSVHEDNWWNVAQSLSDGTKLQMGELKVETRIMERARIKTGKKWSDCLVNALFCLPCMKRPAFQADFGHSKSWFWCSTTQIDASVEWAGFRRL